MNEGTGKLLATVAAILGIAIVASHAVSLIGDGSWMRWPVLALALIFGGLNALLAIGIVLIYRASRVVNFAQAGFGYVAAFLFILLVSVEGWPYYAALPAALLAAALLGLLIEVTCVRRFFNAPRLVVTVVTIAVAQILAAGPFGLRRLFGLEDDDPIPGRIPSPLSRFEWDWNPVIFNGDHLAVVVVVMFALGGLAAFFRFTSVGIAIRGSAENSDRASLLGINVRNLSTLVWILAAALSGVAALAQVPLSGLSTAGTGLAAGLLLRALAAAVLGRMENLPITVAAAVGISMFEQSVFWAFRQTAIVDGVLLAVIVLVLLVQRKSIARAEVSETGVWAASEEVRPIPAELAGLQPVRRGVRWATIAVAVAMIGTPWILSPSQTNLASIFVIFGIIAVSLVILTGWGGQISLGQFAFVAVGGVIGGALTGTLGWPFLLAVPVACLAGAAVAVLIGLPALRIRGLFLAVTTLAFSIAVATVFLNDRFFGWLLPRDIVRPTFFFINTEDERSFFYLAVVSLILSVAAVRGLRTSRTGRVLIAMRDNERAAQSFGLNLVRVRLATFAISGFLAAFAGVLFAHHQHAVSPAAFGPEQSINMFVMAVIGGLGSVSGVLLGAVYIGSVTVFATGFFTLLASGFGLLLVLYFLPTGLGGLAFRLRDAWLRRIAIRHRIFVPSLVADYRIVEGEYQRAQLAPKFGPEGATDAVPVRYRMPDSRIRIAGSSQKNKTWSF